MQYMAVNISSAKPSKEEIVLRFTKVGNELGRLVPEHYDFRMLDLLEALESSIEKGRGQEISRVLSKLAKQIIIREKGN
jgi:hypothetical protein